MADEKEASAESQKTFKAPPAILQRVLAFKALKHKEGSFFLWDVPCLITPLYNMVYLQKMIEDQCGIEKLKNIMFSSGYLIGKISYETVANKFGYAKSIKDKQALLQFMTEQTSVAGEGEFKWSLMDFETDLPLKKMDKALI